MADAAKTDEAAPASEPKSDSRRATRHPYVHFTWFCRVGESAGHVGHTLDVSQAGAALLLSHEVALDERLLLVMVTPAGRVNAIARVVHTAEVNAPGATTWRVGVIIEVIPPTDIAAWEDLAKGPK